MLCRTMSRVLVEIANGVAAAMRTALKLIQIRVLAGNRTRDMTHKARSGRGVGERRHLAAGSGHDHGERLGSRRWLPFRPWWSGKKLIRSRGERGAPLLADEVRQDAAAAPGVLDLIRGTRRVSVSMATTCVRFAATRRPRSGQSAERWRGERRRGSSRTRCTGRGCPRALREFRHRRVAGCARAGRRWQR